jgi:hypothetical protein
LSQHEVIEMLNRISMQPVVHAEVQYVHAEHATTNPHGARQLIYRSVKSDPPKGLQVTLHIDDGNRLSRMVLQPIHAGIVMPQRRQASFSPSATEHPVTPARPRAGWTHALYPTASPPRPARGRGDSHLPTNAPPRQRSLTHADLRQQASAAGQPGQPGQQPRLERFFMDRLPDFQQAGLQHINPEDLGKNEFEPIARYDRHTVDGPHYDAWGQPRYYLEYQIGHACAQHAVNAMIGGPFLPLHAFVRHEHDHQPPGMPRRTLETIDTTIAEEGVQASTVLAVLEGAGIEATSFHPTTATGPAGEPMLDWDQLELIDHLDAERFVLHCSALAEDAHTGAMSVLMSHFVAFRRLPQTQQWCLLDSLKEEPQVVTPSDYLRQRAREMQGPGRSLNDITVIVPQRRLALLGETAGDTSVSSGSGMNAGQAARALQTPGAGPSSGVAATATATATEQPGAARRQLRLVSTIEFNAKEHGKAKEIRYRDENGITKRKVLYLMRFKNVEEFENAAKKITQSIKDGTLEPPPSRENHKHPSPRKGVNWYNASGTNKEHWRVNIKGIIKSVYVHHHNDDVEAASAEAVKLAKEIEANPDKYAEKRRAAHQSLVRGVTWRKLEECWCYKPKGTSTTIRFYPNARTTIVDARMQAERLALSQGAQPQIQPPSRFAPDLKNMRVPLITWNADENAFVVDRDGQPESFPIASYEDVIENARTAAEDRAIEIAQQQAQEGGLGRGRGKRRAREQ